MEPDVKVFLLTIVQTISMALLWLLINMSIGIYYGLAFYEQHLSIWNCVFYIFSLTSFGFLIFYFKKKWKGFKEIGES